MIYYIIEMPSRSALIFAAHMPSAATIVELLKAGAAILSAVAWPLVALIAIFIFRLSIREFFSDVQEFGVAGAFAKKKPAPPLQPAVPAIEGEISATVAVSAPPGAVSAVGEVEAGEQVDGHAPEAVPNSPENGPPESLPRQPKVALSPYALELRGAMRERIATLQNRREREEQLLDVGALVASQLEFERTFRVIYGSQLRLVQRAAIGVVSVEDARAEFATSGLDKTVPPTEFEAWLRYVTYSAALLQGTPEGSFAITVRGRSFLSYLAEHGLISLFKAF